MAVIFLGQVHEAWCQERPSKSTCKLKMAEGGRQPSTDTRVGPKRGMLPEPCMGRLLLGHLWQLASPTDAFRAPYTHKTSFPLDHAVTATREATQTAIIDQNRRCRAAHVSPQPTRPLHRSRGNKSKRKSKQKHAGNFRHSGTKLTVIPSTLRTN